MGIDYAKLRQTATRLLDESKQGVIEYVGAGSFNPGATPLDAPTVSRFFNLTSGIVRGVSQKFVDGETILATDLQAMIRYDAEVSVGDILVIDTVSHVILRIDKIPAAGIPLVQRVFIRK